jgi:ribosomal protein S27E
MGITRMNYWAVECNECGNELILYPEDVPHYQTFPNVAVQRVLQNREWQVSDDPKGGVFTLCADCNEERASY